MARKKMEEDSGGNWMDTYGDMVTLLLTFFVVLYSMSSLEDDKWQELIRAFNINTTTKVDQIVLVSEYSGEELPGNKGVGDGLSPIPGTDGEFLDSGYSELYKIIKDYIDNNEMEEKIEVSEGEGVEDPSSEDVGDKNIYITFKDNVLFMPDKSTLRADSADTLKFLGECLKEVEDEIRLVVIKGHTAKSNTSVVDSRILSAERASTISNFFEDECGIADTLLIPLGLSSIYPIATNDTEEGRTLNRRVEVVIIGKDTELGRSKDILNVLGANYDTKKADLNELTE